MRRSKVRLDKAWVLMELVENGSDDKRPLDIVELMTRIVQDIPSKSLTLPVETARDEWETLAVVVRTAVLTGHVAVPLRAVKQYVPNRNDKQWLEAVCKEKEEGELIPLLTLIVPIEYHFKV